MDYTDVQILSFKKTAKEVTMDYVNDENKNCSITDDQLPHSDLIKALEVLGPTIAAEFWHDTPLKEHFFCSGFTISSKGETEFVVLSGKVETKGDHIVSISSGQLILEADGKGELNKKIEKVRKEAFAYFFENKNAQQKLDFKEKE